MVAWWNCTSAAHTSEVRDQARTVIDLQQLECLAGGAPAHRPAPAAPAHRAPAPSRSQRLVRTHRARSDDKWPAPPDRRQLPPSARTITCRPETQGSWPMDRCSKTGCWLPTVRRSWSRPAVGGAQADAGKHRGRGDADIGAGRMQLRLGRQDIGTLTRQVGRQAHRQVDRQRECGQVDVRQGRLGWHTPSSVASRSSVWLIFCFRGASVAWLAAIRLRRLNTSE
jgi:hypothetical protein